MSEEKYIATGSFANNSIRAFKRYVKDGVLDVEAVTKDYALNERQIPHLKIELEAAGFLPKTDEAKADTKPLRTALKETEKAPQV